MIMFKSAGSRFDNFTISSTTMISTNERSLSCIFDDGKDEGGSTCRKY